MGRFTKVIKGLDIVRRNGSARLLWLGYALLVLPAVMPILPLPARLYQAARRAWQKVEAGWAVERWRRRQAEILESAGGGDGWEAKVPVIDLGRLAPERRNSIVKAGEVAAKKEFHRDRAAFVRELEVQHRLAMSGCHVPALVDVDFGALRITRAYIPGPTLSGKLARCDGGPEDAGSAQRELVESVFVELQKAHAAGVMVGSVSFDDMIVEEGTNRVYWCNLDGASYCPGLSSRVLGSLRDGEIEAYNARFGAGKLTYRRARARVREERARAKEAWYAPVYFGAGLYIGPVWKVDRGYGRWHYILNDHLPSLEGKRILDLGANNGANAIQMLRQGAGEVVGLELDGDFVAQGRFVKAAFEWADNTRYNFRYVQANMAELPEMELGRFDLILALCCLYYLDDQDIARVMRHVGTLTDTFVVQCSRTKTSSDEDQHMTTKASVEYNIQALKANGFSAIKVIDPKGYSRPLLIASKDS